ncbi:MAG: hypothetical protein ACKOHI_13625, partial [Phycisphaerales bacterium]
MAVIHRAALGGGLELAMHCDALVGTLPGEGEKPWLVGLPEAGLCICPGWGGTQMLPARMDPKTAMVATASGAPWKCTDVPAGLFDVVMPSVRPTCTQWKHASACSLGGSSPRAARSAGSMRDESPGPIVRRGA